ncbi:hypothetical protein E2C01_009978 [Portunus trituberculatus]|uniref:Uncharacterized protein n=1 Tax=Portunus trituberculatus TaxID=210409 RepID=A0A5B7D753_PORTR|nr:hypothetical protein [Portunus trituberculatus]
MMGYVEQKKAVFGAYNLLYGLQNLLDNQNGIHIYTKDLESHYDSNHLVLKTENKDHIHIQSCFSSTRKLKKYERRAKHSR